MKPFILDPAFQDYLWGGQKLKSEFHKRSDLNPLAESWELSCHEAGPCVIATGEHQGKKLKDLISDLASNKEQRLALLGRNCERFDYFPLLIKLIDAKQSLSVQVHPDDEYAQKNEGGELGKTELWYVVEADPGAEILYGFDKEITQKEFKQRIADNTILEVIKRVPVRAGDVFLIEAGTLHAIGAGIVIAEIQQNSNLTYRIYDYDRRDAQGNPRELHVDKAVEVTKLMPTDLNKVEMPDPEVTNDYVRQRINVTQFFEVSHVSVMHEVPLITDGSSFHCILVLDGKFNIEDLTINKGQTVFVPANWGEYLVRGRGEILLVQVPAELGKAK